MPGHALNTLHNSGDSVTIIGQKWLWTWRDKQADVVALAATWLTQCEHGLPERTLPIFAFAVGCMTADDGHPDVPTLHLRYDTWHSA